METPLKLQGARHHLSGSRRGPSIAQVQLGAMLETGMEMEATEVLLMKMLVHGRTASGWQGRPHCAPYDLPAATVDWPAYPGELRV